METNKPHKRKEEASKVSVLKTEMLLRWPQLRLGTIHTISVTYPHGFFSLLYHPIASGS